MFEGEIENGELEIGQVSSLIRNIVPAATVVQELIRDCRAKINELSRLDDF